MKRCESLRIVAMEEADLPSVLEIERRSHLDPWTETIFLNELRQPFSRLLIARYTPSGAEDCAPGAIGAVAGYICFWCVADEVQIHNVSVRESCRSLGIGRGLLLAALRLGTGANATVALLDVRAGNVPALRLYRALGFEVTGIRRNYYGPNEGDAILMRLSLEGFAEGNPISGTAGNSGSPTPDRSRDEDH